MLPGMLGKFNPLKIPGCALWLEANKGIVITGVGVSSWIDQSGNGRTVVQTTDSKRPTYVVDGINGHPALNFLPDATARILSIASDGLSRNIGNLTVCVVYKHSADTTSYDGPFHSRGAGTSRALIYRTSGNTRGSLYGRRLDGDADNQSDYSADIFNDSAHIITCEFDWTNSSAYIWLDGTLVVNDSTWAGTDGLTSDTSGPLFVGGHSDGQPFRGLISVVIAYRRPLDTSERQRLEGYYGRTYGIQVSGP
jgi:hypothetical protein